MQRRECLVPTWRGWLGLLLLAFALTAGLLLGAHPFLSVNAPLKGGVVVVEGWMADYNLQRAIKIFQAAGYEKMYVTGGPIEAGAPLSQYRTYAELGAATLKELGMNTNALQAVPAPGVRQDRTYTSALSLKRWLEVNGSAAQNITVITEGPHARRSWLLFRMAFGKDASVGIIGLTPYSYDSKRWWRSSQGVRVVVGETLAYGYARFAFRPPQQEPR